MHKYRNSKLHTMLLIAFRARTKASPARLTFTVGLVSSTAGELRAKCVSSRMLRVSVKPKYTAVAALVSVWPPLQFRGLAVTHAGRGRGLLTSNDRSPSRVEGNLRRYFKLRLRRLMDYRTIEPYARNVLSVICCVRCVAVQQQGGATTGGGVS